jgi:hypothetical protein
VIVTTLDFVPVREHFRDTFNFNVPFGTEGGSEASKTPVVSADETSFLKIN